MRVQRAAFFQSYGRRIQYLHLSLVEQVGSTIGARVIETGILRGSQPGYIFARKSRGNTGSETVHEDKEMQRKDGLDSTFP